MNVCPFCHGYFQTTDADIPFATIPCRPCLEETYDADIRVR